MGVIKKHEFQTLYIMHINKRAMRMSLILSSGKQFSIYQCLNANQIWKALKDRKLLLSHILEVLGKLKLLNEGDTIQSNYNGLSNLLKDIINTFPRIPF